MLRIILCLFYFLELLFKCFLCLRKVFDCLLLLQRCLLCLSFRSGLIVIENSTGILLVVGGFLQLLSGLWDYFSHVFANKVGAIHKVGLGALHFLGLSGIFLFGNFLGFLDNLFLPGHSLFNVANGLADNFLLVTFRSEDARDVDHGSPRTTFVAGGALETRTLNVGERAFEGGIEFGLYLFESQLGAGFVGGVELLAQLREFLNERGGFITDAGLIELLQAQVNLGAFLVACGGGLVRHDHGAIHVVLLRVGETYKTAGELAENLLALPIKVYLLQLHGDLFLSRESPESISVILSNDTGVLELFHDLAHLRLRQIVEHAAEAFQRVHIIAFQRGEIVLGNNRIDLSRDTLQACANAFLTQFLPE